MYIHNYVIMDKVLHDLLLLLSSLVYIAGLCYQWLKNDVLSEDLLRMGEIILLRVCVPMCMYILGPDCYRTGLKMKLSGIH